MNYQLLVGVLDRIADLYEESQPIADVQSLSISVLIERLAIDVLHHKVGISVRRGPAAQQPADVRMIQRCQDLPFVAEPPQNEIAIKAAFDQFDRDAMLKLSVSAPGFINRAHAPAPDFP